MSKTGLVAVLFAVITMTAASAAPKKSETERAVFGPYQAMEDVSSEGTPVIVGTNVLTYSPGLIDLYLSESLVANTEISYGWHSGKARCLKKNGPEGGRLDFYFQNCVGDDLSSCSYRLIVRFGIYDRKAGVVVFDLAEMQLYTTDGQYLTTGSASFSVAFQAED
jgi:hypothetical protein